MHVKSFETESPHISMLRNYEEWGVSDSRQLGGSVLASPFDKPKFAVSILSGVDRFFGCENRRHAYHMIMQHVKDLLSINLAIPL
ncbi:hypothetical protein TNCV_3165091 [Trichonephila clavipes]|nr:hypothetical protein TNCV_3165091 [Trichonephila clavipes]